ncbi:hypothetical protein AYO21_09632 [Fonsecaea monophora]|uniref:RRM domain-containing protein n=1 Tax=Fonsecaea monophora TaxID=254056 RepID=A0A177EVU1_9EURO|nr:hypothetical protein AYO21_09632 [Fonsecaea monophora]OAG36164.1 hypothetical protein AYO21_09632 [Fonsecaea monophora]
MSGHSKSRAAAGVLPVNAATRKNATAQSASKSSPRTPAPRLRLIVRRLPPGLTETEFWATLGDDWKVGNGKVEWAAYKDGKVSKDPAKPSRPARAYLKVKEQTLLDVLSKLVRESSFQDAKNTTRDPCLLGPPSLEFAPYNKMPVPRVRHDGRQGTIDQDQEFIDFLQSLTEPINKPAPNGAEATDIKADTITVTPLVQYIKEKKANKAKEAAQAKAAKRESKEAKPTKSERTPTVIIKGKNTPNSTEKEKDRVAKATHDGVKSTNKSAPASQGKQTASTKSESKQTSVKDPRPQSPATPGVGAASAPATTPAKRERNRERDSGRAAARMLQRDLGLLAKENTSQRTPKSPSNTATANDKMTSSSAAKPSTSTTSKSSGPSTEQSKPVTPTTASPAAPPTGPRASRTPNTTSTKSEPSGAASASSGRPTANQRQSKTSSSQQPTTGAKSAFLKHANPSQGITEDLLQQVFKEFGAITRCEIDKKKGLGYVDFQDPEALKKAMAASPVKVAQGQVVVLENKSHHSQQSKRGGGGGGGSGGSQNQATSGQGKTRTASPAAAPATVNSPKPNAAQTLAAETSTSAATIEPAPTTPTSATPPTAPRGNSRGGGSGARTGGRGNSGGKKEGARGGGGSGSGQGQGGNKGSAVVEETLEVADVARGVDKQMQIQPLVLLVLLLGA